MVRSSFNGFDARIAQTGEHLLDVGCSVLEAGDLFTEHNSKH